MSLFTEDGVAKPALAAIEDGLRASVLARRGGRSGRKG